MTGKPMEACLGLGLIINEVNELDNFQDNLITFDSNPRFINFNGCNSYFQKIKVLQDAPWGMNTNFFKTMKLVAD